MSLYKDYIKEREGFECLENDLGFASYKITGEECYIRDIYVVPEKRKSDEATMLATLIEDKAIAQGCKWLTGTVDPRFESRTTSTKVLLAYGFKIHSVSSNSIVFVKEL